MQDEHTPADRHLPAILQQFEIAPCRALEIGCGTGLNLVWLATLGFECTGIDSASAFLRLARDKAAAAAVQCRWIRGTFPEDTLENRLPNGSFDLIFDRGVFELVTSPTQQRKFLRRVQQLLSPRGVYYSLIAKKERRQLPGGGARWTAPQIRNAISPYLHVVITRQVPLDPSDRTSPPCLLCVMRPYGKRRLTLTKRFPFIGRR